jgi:hypothetical protein
VQAPEFFDDQCLHVGLLMPTALTHCFSLAT